MNTSAWRTYSERWYAGYAFQGAVVLGVAPILLPLLMDKAGGAGQAGAVVATFYAGQLTAPLLGKLTDSLRLHRLVYLAGYVLLALGLGLFPLAHSLTFWFLLAFLQGMGSAATNTVSAMFIVETKPKDQWDQRIGWLQTFYGFGQAIGLGLAALLQAAPTAGMVIAAALMLPGVLLGRLGLPHPADHEPRAAKPAFNRGRHFQPRLLFASIHLHGPNIHKQLAGFLKVCSSRFGLYIASWFCVMYGTWIIYNLYPLLMDKAYGLTAGPSSLYYALAAGLGVFAYAPSGSLGKRWGDGAVVMAGTVMTLASTAGMAWLAYFSVPGESLLVPAFFILLPVAWSPLIVAGTAFTAQLGAEAGLADGASMGVFNATTAIASVLAAVSAGGAADWLGYGSLPLIGAGLTVVGGVLLLPLLRGENKAG